MQFILTKRTERLALMPSLITRAIKLKVLMVAITQIATSNRNMIRSNGDNMFSLLIVTGRGIVSPATRLVNWPDGPLWEV